MPLYITGHFRTSDDKTIRISLELERGDKAITTLDKSNVPLDAAMEFLRGAAVAFLTKISPGSTKTADPRVEAKQLAALARSQADLGSWRDANNLIEASLLLDPTQLELRLDALEVLTRMIGEEDRHALGVPTSARVPETGRGAYYERGLEHLEKYLRSVRVDRKRKRECAVMIRFATSLDWWSREMLRNKFLSGTVSKGAGKMGPTTLDRLQSAYLGGEFNPRWPEFMAARRASSEMYYRVLEAKRQNKVVDDTLSLTTNFDEWAQGCSCPRDFAGLMG